MQPTVTQQLQAMRTAMESTVMPALGDAGAFVQEQAGLMLATLDWIMDVHESEYRLEYVANREYRSHLEALGESPGPEPAIGDLAATREQNRALKQRAIDLLGDGRGRAELLALADRQGRREQAWFRMTGFPEDVPGAIGEVLTEAGA